MDVAARARGADPVPIKYPCARQKAQEPMRRPGRGRANRDTVVHCSRQGDNAAAMV